jgi:hypothetical protein
MACAYRAYSMELGEIGDRQHVDALSPDRFQARLAPDAARWARDRDLARFVREPVADVSVIL